MTVRAKFTVTEKTLFYWSKDSVRIKLVAQYDQTIPEDQRFAKATPNGEFWMQVDNPAAAEVLELGKGVLHRSDVRAGIDAVKVRISVYVEEADEPHARRYIENILSAIPHDLTVEPVPPPTPRRNPRNRRSNPNQLAVPERRGEHLSRYRMFDWPKDGCPVCGREWDDWCIRHHLPVARAVLAEAEHRLARMRLEVEAADRIIAAKRVLKAWRLLTGGDKPDLDDGTYYALDSIPKENARMKLATVEFHLVGVDVPDVPDAPGNPSKYVECYLVFPPVDFVTGVGVSLAESFANLQARVLDSAVTGALQVYELGGQGGSDNKPGDRPGPGPAGGTGAETDAEQ